MATYDYDVANLALVRLGANRITSLGDGSKNANEINSIFTQVRNEIMRDHPWGFATRYQNLFPAVPNVLTVVGILKENPGTVAYTGTAPEDGDTYYAESIGGMTDLNGANFIINNHSAAISTQLVTNGNMETGVLGAPSASWTSVSSPTTNELSNTQVHGGAMSLKVVTDSGSDGVQSAGFTTTTGAVYRVIFWIYPSVTSFTVVVYNGATGSSPYTYLAGVTVTAGTWNQVSFIYRETAGGALANIRFILGSPIGTFYIDDVTITKVGTFDVYNDDAEAIDLTSYPVWTSGGTFTRVLPENANSWTYIYTLPSRVLRVLEINDDPDEDFEVIELRYLLSNTESCLAKLITTVSDVTRWDQTFDNLLAWRLAMEVAMAITGDSEKAKYASQMYNYWSARAKATDASEGRTENPKDNRYKSARR